MLEVTTVVRAANAVSACESSGRSAYGSRSSSKVSTAVRKALDLLTAQDSDLELESAQAALGFRLDERGGVSVRLRVRGGVELRLGNPLTVCDLQTCICDWTQWLLSDALHVYSMDLAGKGRVKMSAVEVCRTGENSVAGYSNTTVARVR